MTSALKGTLGKFTNKLRDLWKEFFKKNKLKLYNVKFRKRKQSSTVQLMLSSSCVVKSAKRKQKMKCDKIFTDWLNLLLKVPPSPFRKKSCNLLLRGKALRSAKSDKWQRRSGAALAAERKVCSASGWSLSLAGKGVRKNYANQC